MPGGLPTPNGREPPDRFHTRDHLHRVIDSVDREDPEVSGAASFNIETSIHAHPEARKKRERERERERERTREDSN